MVAPSSASLRFSQSMTSSFDLRASNWATSASAR
jgi:hypothetical protein